MRVYGTGSEGECRDDVVTRTDGGAIRRRRVSSVWREALCLLLCATLVVGLVPGSGMAWAAERDLEALSSFGPVATATTEGVGTLRPATADVAPSAASGKTPDAAAHTTSDSATTPGAVAGRATDNAADDAYSLRLIVSLGGGQSVRPRDVVLGDHGQTVLLGFADDEALAEGLAWYSDPDNAEWAEVDAALGVATDEVLRASDGEPDAVGDGDNAFALLEAAESAAADPVSADSVSDPVSQRAAAEAAAAASSEALAAGGSVAEAAEAAGLAASRAASRRRLLGDGADSSVLVALVDTGAPLGKDGVPDGAVVAAESVVAAKGGADSGQTPDLILAGPGLDIDPDRRLDVAALDANGHATRMLQAMAEGDPSVKVVSIKALDDTGRGSMSSLYAAIELAVELGADVANLSLAGRVAEGSAAVAEAIARASDAGMAVVAAAGNDGEDASGFVPASCEDVLAVGAAAADGTPLPTSNFGSAVDMWVVAPSTSVAAARATGWLSGNAAVSDPSPACALRADWRDVLLGSDLPVVLVAGDAGPANAEASPSGDKAGDGSVMAADGTARATMSGDTAVTLSGIDVSAPTVGATLTATVDATAASYADALGAPTSLAAEEATALRYHFELKFVGDDGKAHVAGRADAAAGANAATMSVAANAMGHTLYAEASDASGTVGGTLRSVATAGAVTARTDGVAYAALLDVGNTGYALNTLLFMRVPENGLPEEGDTELVDVDGNRWNALRFWTGFEGDVPYSSVDNAPWYESHASVVHVAVVPGQVVRPKHLAFWFLDFTNAALTFDFDGFDTSQATSGKMSLQGMFWNCTGIKSLSLGQLDTSKASIIDSMFEGCTNLLSLDVSQLDTHNVTTMQRVFRQCGKLVSLDLSNFDTSNVTVMYHMFYQCKGLTSLDVSSFDTGKLKSALRLFEGCSSLTSLDVSSFRTSTVTTMYAWFSNCSSLTSLDLSNFDTSNVTTMYYMFNGCSSLTSLDLSNFDTAKVATMTHMFTNCSKLQSLAIDKDRFNTAACAAMDLMFSGCVALESLDVSGFDTPKVSDMSFMFNGCGKLSAIDVSGFDTTGVVNMQSMFAGCQKVTALDVSRFNTSSATTLNKMFDGCSLVEELDVSGWRTPKVTNMEATFARCPKVKVLDLSGWDASSVTTMSQMFQGSSSLEALDLSSMDTSQVTTMREMLTGCLALASLDLGGKFSIEGIANAPLLPDIKALDGLESVYLGAWASYNAAPEHASARRSVTLPREDAGDGAQWWDAEGGRFDGGTTIVPETSQQAQLLWTSAAPGIYAILEEGVLTVKVEAGRPTEDWYADELGATAWAASGDDGGTVVQAGSDSPGRPWEGERASITKVVFDGTNGKVRPTSMSCWFRGMTSLAEIDLSGLDSSLATSVAHAFDGCGNLASVDLASFAAPSASDLSCLFLGCSELSELDLAAWEIPSATNLSRLFDGCAKLTSLDLSGLDTSGVSDMTDMLAGCSQLEVLEMGGLFSLSSVEAGKLPSLAGLGSLRSAYLGAWVEHNAADPAPSQTLSVTLPHADDDSGLAWWDTDGASHAGGSTLAPLTPAQAQLMWGTVKPGIYARLSGGTLTFKLFCGTPDGAQGWGQSDLSATAWDARPSDQPWKNARAQITRVVFDGSNGKVRPRSMGEWFYGLNNLADLDFSGLDSSQSTSFYETFHSCVSLRTLDFLALDTTSAASMHAMFNGCTSLASADLSRWDTSKVLDMYRMFYNCMGLVAVDLAGVDTSQVTDMTQLFYYCSGLKVLDVSGLDTSSVTSMKGMFYNCNKLTTLDVSGFRMGSAQDISSMFQSCSSVSVFDLSRWETPELRSMNSLFRGCQSIRMANFSSCDTSKVTDMKDMFNGSTYLNTLNLGGSFSIASVDDDKLPDLTTLTYLTTVDLGAWVGYNEGRDESARRSVVLPANTSTSGGGRAWWDREGYSYAGDSAITPTSPAMAQLTWSLPQIYAGYDADSHTLTFRNGGSVGPAGYYETKLTSLNWSNANSQPWKDVRTSITQVVFDATRGGKMVPQYMAYWFSGCTSLESVDLSGVDSAQVKSFKAMFDGCTSLEDVGLSYLDTSAATNMSYMFQDCRALSTLDVSRLFVDKVGDLSYLFYGCEQLGSLALARWDTSSATNMAYLFYGCSSLASLDLSSLDTSKVSNMTAMFTGCSSLRTLEMGGQFSIAGVTATSKLPTLAGLTSLTSVYLGAWVDYNEGLAASSMRSVTLSTPTGGSGAWWDSVGAPYTAQYQGGASVTPTTAAEARLVWGTARPGIYARLASGVLTIRVSSGTPAGTGWYAADLSTVSWSSADEQPWAQVRGSISSVVFDGSGGKAMPTNMAWWLAGLSAVTSVDLSGLDSSQADDLSHLFDGCASLGELDLSSLSTASAGAMASMFDGCSSLCLVTLGFDFDFSGRLSTPLAALPSPEGEPTALWCRVRDRQGTTVYDGTGRTAAQLASSYDGSLTSWRGTWEAQRLVALGANGGEASGGTPVQVRAVSLDQLAAKALAAGLTRAYCGLAGWSSSAPATGATDALPTLAWDATLVDARAA